MWWRNELKKRVKSLLVPYLIWVAVGIAFGNENLLISIGLTLDPPNPTHMWFLRALMILIVVSPIVALVVRGRNTGICCLLVLLVASFIFGQNYLLPWLGVFCFVLGAFIRFNQICLGRTARRMMLITSLLALCFSVFMQLGGGNCAFIRDVDSVVYYAV